MIASCKESKSILKQNINLEKNNLKIIPLYQVKDFSDFDHSTKKEFLGIFMYNDKYELSDIYSIIKISINVEILDKNGVVSNVPIRIVASEKEKKSIIYLSLTDQYGQAKSDIIIPKKFTTLQLEIIMGNFIAEQMINLYENQKYLVEINRKYYFNQILKNVIFNQIDSDSDGVPDSIDSYPFDSKRAANIQAFTEFPLLIAVEEDFSEGGNLDYNDLVLQVSFEEDRDSFNNLVRFRGTFMLLAKGGHHSHILYLNFFGKGNYHSKLYNSKIQTINKISINLKPLQKIPLFLKSSKYLENFSNEYVYLTNQICKDYCNVYATKNIKTNFKLEVEMIFEEPIHNTSSPFPINLSLYNLNKNTEILILFTQKKEPNVLILPYGWNWPLEEADIFIAYPYFKYWLESNGEFYKDWYEKEHISYVFPYFYKNPLSAYLLQMNVQQSMIWAFLLIFITGILVFLFIKGRNESYD